MIHISKYCHLCIFMLDTQILFNLQVQQHKASGTDHKHRKRLQENTWYSPLDSDLRKLSTVLPKSWSASDWNSYPQLRKSLTPKTPPPRFFPVLSKKTHWVLDAFCQHNIFCLPSLGTKSRNQGPLLKAPAIVCLGLCGTPSQLYHCGLLCTELLLCSEFTRICAAEMIQKDFSALLK